MRNNPLLLLLLLLVAAIAVGDYFMPYGPFTAAPAWPPEAATHTGIVTQTPVCRGNTVRMVLRLPDGHRIQLTGVADSTQASPTPAAAVRIPAPGDAVVFHAVVEEPRNAGNPGEMDYAAYLRHQGITGTAFCYAPDWRRLGPSSDRNLRERMLLARQHAVDLYAAHFDGEVLAVIAAMTLGDRSRIDKSTRDLYSRTGSSHVIALSGLHLSILVGLLMLLLAPLRRRAGRVGTFAVHAATLLPVWAYVLLAGLPLSLVRAATMLTVVLLLQSLRRSSSAYHALVVAVMLILLVSPSALFDVGFQLSVVAVAAIQTAVQMRSFQSPLNGSLRDVRLRLLPLHLRLASALMRLVPRRRRSPRALAAVRQALQRCVQAAVSLFLVSLAAQIATMPLVAHYFHTITLTGLLTVWFVIPAATVILVGSLLYLLLPPLRSLLAMALGGLVSTVHGMMGTVAALPFATASVSLSWWGVASCYAVMLFVLWAFRGHLRRRLRRPALAVAAGAVLVFVAAAGEMLIAWSQRPATRMAVYNRPTHMELHLTTPTTDSIITRLADDDSRLSDGGGHTSDGDSRWGDDDSRTSDDCHVIGNVVSFAGRRLAVVDHLLPYVGDITMPAPLAVDAVLITRGAKGHLADILLRYSPAVVVIDASLSDYYRQRFVAEAADAHLSVYDVRERGAWILEAAKVE